MHLKGNRRKFNGKYYTAVSSKDTKSDAKKYASRLRKQGHLARIVKSKSKKDGLEYYIYKRN